MVENNRSCPTCGCSNYSADWDHCAKDRAALQARVKELEAKVEWLQRNNDACVDDSETITLKAQLDEAHKREAVLREAIGNIVAWPPDNYKRRTNEGFPA